MITLAGIGAECRVTDFTPCHGHSSRALQRQRRRCLLGHPERWLHRAQVCASWDVSRCDAAARWLSCTSQQPRGICLQMGRGEERSHLLCNCTLWLSQPSESQAPLNGQWLQHRGWGHDDLSSSFVSLVLCQCVPRASLTAVPRVCPCDHFLGDSCLFISIGLLVCRVWIYWHRWRKPQTIPFHSMVILI